MDYKSAGVDIKAGVDSVNRIKPLVKETFNSNVLSHIGGFGGLYQVDLTKWKEPVLVSSADGVGTKLIIARMAGIYDTVGQDLVNHCVNDILVQGAIPQYFLDYVGVGKLKPAVMEKIIFGFSKACKENGMALIGGEMAEMPGIYSEDDFDLAGTIVGMVEKKDIITGKEIKAGDVLLGLSSTGLHTNGYSLARKILFDKLNYTVDTILPEIGETVAEVMLKVHRSYLNELVEWATPKDIHGMAHITGGGIPGNLSRVIPDGVTANVDSTSWETPAIFKLLQEGGGIEISEMYRAFNMGIGMIVVVDQSLAETIMKKTDAIVIGNITEATTDEKVRMKY
ncbi:MAG: phosphoribosylformylglycinamidine cyclo-ligase [Candidatus Cloacimonetes bacterium 4572_65]|nr:MAG: phosphoribosylformylglycinamidine cyclo-ligase [Candidatus Cloacimonetes bacterium 4572_65]